MRKVAAAFMLVGLLCFGGTVHADVLHMGPGLTSLETVTVGDSGNAPDTSVGLPYHGSVDYTFNIGKCEVTTAQYVEFLNAKAKTDPYGLYNPKMANILTDDFDNAFGCNIIRSGSDGSYTYSVAAEWANKPVNYVSYWDACRFVNWLSNGQGDGDTETGAYTLNGYNDWDGYSIKRNPGWKWAIPTEQEWYKAAYYDPYKPGDSKYWLYATRSSDQPLRQTSATDPGNSAFYGFTTGDPCHLMNVGEFEKSASAYGTFDQSGNVGEWNEGVITDGNLDGRGERGGSFGADENMLASNTYSCYGDSNVDESYTGFRVVQAYHERVCGISNKAANTAIMSSASTRFSFKVWGKVKLLSDTSFSLDDGSGCPVAVIAPGFSGISDGDYASASGKFSGDGAGRALNALPINVVKLR